MQRVTKSLFYLSLALVIYMPLHVFIVQSVSLVTGGLEVWKAAKDVLIFILLPLLLFLSFKKGLWQNKTFRTLLILGGVYSLLHGLFVLFDTSDDTYSTIVGSVYNTRLLIYLLLGYVVGASKNGEKYLRYLLTAAVLIATAVSVFAIAQYFLPSDLLTHVGYSLERGVKPLFFIDDRTELPRVMSTLKDPNSLGAYLILPVLLTGFALIKQKANKVFFVREFRREVLFVMLSTMLIALLLTFSRGALLGLLLSIVAALFMISEGKTKAFLKKYFPWLAVSLVLVGLFLFQIRNAPIVQDYVFHAAVSTDQEDPNEKRLTLYEEAIEDIVEEPEGHGPGSAGLVSISNPNGGLLTENYFLQIAYEVGWLGLVTFLAILTVIYKQLRQNRNYKLVSIVILSSLVGYLFYSLLIHLWSNEAIALQWWLLCGALLGAALFIETDFAKD